MSDSGVAIIGGGVLGLCAAYELANRGVQPVTVFDRDEIGAATSAAGAGFLSIAAVGDIPEWQAEEADFERYALTFYRELDAAGYDIDYKQNGTIWVDVDGSQHHTFARLMSNPHEPVKRLLTASEVEDLTGGVVQARAITGGVLYGSSADIYGPLLVKALATICRQLGVEIREHTRIEELYVTGGVVTGLRSSAGIHRALSVVVAAGPWANQVLHAVGAWLPQAPLVLWRATTSPCDVPGSLPQIFLPGVKQFFLREHHNAFIWGASLLGTPQRFAFLNTTVPEHPEIPPSGFDEARQALAELREVLPSLAANASTSVVAAGVPVYTPDARSIVGPVDGLSNLHVLAGCNQSGYLHGPGMARLLAEQIVNRAPSIPNPFAPNRFSAITTEQEVLTALTNHDVPYFV